jgi:hypothetical protein
MPSLDEQHDLLKYTPRRVLASCGAATGSRARLFIRAVALITVACVVATACSGGGKADKVISGSSTPRAELPPGGNANPSTSAHHPGAAGQSTKVHARLVLNNGKINVCSLITRKQVDQVMQKRLPRPTPVIVGTFSECSTTEKHAAGSHVPLHAAWAVPPEEEPGLVFKRMTINLPSADAVRGLGHDAYCSSSESPVSAQLFVIDGHTLLEVFADTCHHATELARYALGRI